MIHITEFLNTYGPQMNIDNSPVVSNFNAQALRREPTTVQAPRTQNWNYRYVSHMVDDLIRLMKEDFLSGLLSKTGDVSIEIEEQVYVFLAAYTNQECNWWGVQLLLCNLHMAFEGQMKNMTPNIR